MSTLGTWDELFGNGRKWRVAEELTGTVTAAVPLPDRRRRSPAVSVAFSRGEFELPPGTAYRSLLSTNLGRRGVVLQETDPTGAHDVPGARIAVGLHAVARVREQYGAIW